MQVVKNLAANAGDARDTDSIPGSGRSPAGGNGNPFSILAWRIPWTEDPGGVPKKSDMVELYSTSIQILSSSPSGDENNMTMAPGKVLSEKRKTKDYGSYCFFLERNTPKPYCFQSKTKRELMAWPQFHIRINNSRRTIWQSSMSRRVCHCPDSTIVKSRPSQ